MKTAADLNAMPMAEVFGYQDGFNNYQHNNTWLRPPVNEEAAAEYERGYNIGRIDRTEAKQSAADLRDEQETQRDALR